jgi:AraC-like DNA-binding protein
MRDVPLVLVTAKTSAADRVEGLSIADEFVAKPFRMPELVARVRNLLRRAGPAGSGPPPASRTAPASPAGAGRSVPAPEPTAAPPGMPEHDRQFLDRLRAVVVAHLADEGFSVPRLARSMALSPRQFQRRCRDLTGQGPVEYVRGVRMEEARALVRRGAYRTVAEVAAAVGMSAAYFARLYSAWHGHPPSEDLRG